MKKNLMDHNFFKSRKGFSFWWWGPVRGAQEGRGSVVSRTARVTWKKRWWWFHCQKKDQKCLSLAPISSFLPKRFLLPSLHSNIYLQHKIDWLIARKSVVHFEGQKIMLLPFEVSRKRWNDFFTQLLDHRFTQRGKGYDMGPLQAN